MEDENNRLRDYFNAHRTCRALDALDRCIHRGCVQIGHLLRGNLAHLGLSNLTLSRGLYNIRFAPATAPFGRVQPMDHDEGQGDTIIDVLHFGGGGEGFS